MSDQRYQALLGSAVERGLPDDWFALGSWLHDQKRWVAAAAAFARVLAVEPEHQHARTNYGWALHLGGRVREALVELDRAIGLGVDDGMAHACRAQVRMILGEDAGAVEDGLRAIELGRGVPLHHLAASFALLNAGEYARGWRENEWRFQYTLPEFLERPYRLWRGEKVDTLYIEAEQGLGDLVFACRWFPEVFERVGKAIVYVHKEGYSLMCRNFHDGEKVFVYPLPRPLPTADAFCPVMSIPAALEIDHAEARDAYLKV